MREKYHCFIGRWSPPHLGHAYLWKTAHEEDGLPILVLVRDSEDLWPPLVRRDMVEATLDDLGIPGYAEVIPDIESVDYGRDVGYRVRQLAPDGCPQISGTAIRAAICNGDEAGWISVVTHTVAQIIKRGRNDPKYPLLA